MYKCRLGKIYAAAPSHMTYNFCLVLKLRLVLRYFTKDSPAYSRLSIYHPFWSSQPQVVKTNA